MQGFQVYDVMKNGARVLTADYARGKFNVYHYEDSYIVVDVPKNGLPWIDRVENRWVHAAHFAIQRVADGLKAERDLMLDSRAVPANLVRDLKLSEVEQLTGLSRSTLYRQLAEGTLCGRRVSNGSWRVPYGEVERLLSEPNSGR